MTTKSILEQIDTILAKGDQFRASINTIRSDYGPYHDYSSESAQEIVTAMAAVVDRFASDRSRYRSELEHILNAYRGTIVELVDRLIGVLKALRFDYENGFLATVQELIHADLFTDFIEMASYFLNEGYKDPAAVMAGGVLEEHLRKLCLKNGLPIEDVKPNGNEPKKASRLNDDLAGQNVYSKTDQKSVTAWLGLRNDAAHGNYGNYTKEQISLMVQGIRDFLVRNPA